MPIIYFKKCKLPGLRETSRPPAISSAPSQPDAKAARSNSITSRVPKRLAKLFRATVVRTHASPTFRRCNKRTSTTLPKEDNKLSSTPCSAEDRRKSSSYKRTPNALPNRARIQSLTRTPSASAHKWIIFVACSENSASR